MKCILGVFLLTCVLCWTEAIVGGMDERWRFSSTSVNGECILDRDESKYTGKLSVTVSGRICAPWNSIKSSQYSAFKNCHHNYCRNPDDKIQPWCMVKKRYRYVKEYCDMSREAIKPVKRPPTPEPIKQDTELTCGDRRFDRISKIIGGLRSPVESQPWMAAIFKGSGFICGGTLIAPCWVLTAAHCFPTGNNTQISRYSVVLGKNAINETDPVKEQKFTVSRLVIHEDFNYSTENYTHDIALLKIEDSNGRCAVQTKTVRTACLPPFQQMLPVGFYCEIAGYGRYQKGIFQYSRHLKQAQVKLISHNACQTTYYSEDEVNENMLCANGRDWKEDACQGDSGGPLVCEVNNTMFLFGIISWGKECAERNNPGVYTKVSNYNQWISQHTGLPKFTAGSRYPQKD